jgi:hypothetical protein
VSVGPFAYDERLEGAVIGGMAVTVLLLVALIILCIIRRCITLPSGKIAAGNMLLLAGVCTYTSLV